MLSAMLYCSGNCAPSLLLEHCLKKGMQPIQTVSSGEIRRFSVAVSWACRDEDQSVVCRV